ncbi:MAG TPA: hypothetical protein VK934_11475 [Fimbriimonas sp.]|nr:hypothetical protein [Fimbriimonas sp.]
MEQGGLIVLFALAAIAIVVIGVLVSQAQRRAAEARRAALLAIAEEYGLEFYPFGLDEPARGFLESLFTGFGETNLGRFLDRFQGFAPFGQGHTFKLTNLMVGRRNDSDWYAFDYLYHTTHSTGKTTTTVPHPTGVVAVRVPLALPMLTMTPENLFHKIGNALGMEELDFELEEFNKRYFVRCSDRKMAYDLLHPRMIDYLMTKERRAWQIAGQFILLTKGGYYTPDEIRATVQEIEGFMSLVPRYVEQDHGLPVIQASPLD